MTDNTLRPIAPSGFDGMDPSEKMEAATPDRSGVESGVYVADRGLPWHVELSRQLGEAELMQATGQKMTLAEVLELSGAAFDVDKWPLQAAPVIDGVRVEPLAVDVPRKYATVRTDTNTPLAVVGEQYTVIQNADALRFADDIIDDSGAHYETAGVMAGGAKVFVSMELPDHIRVEGDPSDYRLYLVMMTGHDGKTKTSYFTTVERAVCRNTVRIGRERAVSETSIKHTANGMSRVAEARKALGISFAAVETFAETASALVSKTLADRQVDDILDRLFPLTEKQAEKVDKDPSKMAITTQGKVRDLYHSSESVEPIRGTAYGVLNAVTEYLDHYQPFHSSVMSKGDAKAKSLLLGTGDEQKQRAVALLTRWDG